jgi:hypothetical protein
MICASEACRPAAIRNTAVVRVSAPQSVLRSPPVFHPVSSMFTTGERLSSCSSRVCGAASASPARWTTASTVPVESSTPNSSRASSVVARRETRLRTASVTTAAWSRGPNAHRDAAGASAVVTDAHSAQQTRCNRYSVTRTAVGGSSAT